MNDTQQAEQKAPETVPAQVESPTTEGPITGDKTEVKVSDDQGTVAEKPDIESTMTEEQRRAFQEMRLENKRLKESVGSREDEGSAFDMFRAQTPPISQPIQLDVRNFTDPVTGETNWQAYNLAQQQREQHLLQQARFEAQQTVTEQMDENNARSKYPELFADKNTEKLIAAQWFFEKAQGRNVPITQIAGEFARNFKQAVSKAEKISTEKVLNEVSEKEQAAATANQTTSGAQIGLSQDEHINLVSRTRQGDDDAIVSRLSKIPWANK